MCMGVPHYMYVWVWQLEAGHSVYGGHTPIRHPYVSVCPYVCAHYHWSAAPLRRQMCQLNTFLSTIIFFLAT